ncbi:MAG TPA: L-seryl-tRNA(Sec) selenium transferase [Desulfotomaculum sp.]|nr:L-seryl-tRNA(Sec) selenium transferase [Desulfotomaculum sp.]
MPRKEKNALLRRLPAVDEVLRWPEIGGLFGVYSRGVIVEAVRKVLAEVRDALLQGETQDLGREALVRRVDDACRPRLRRVINATGVVLHTNLGRAVLSEGAQRAVIGAAGGYSNLEFDLTTGKRGERYSLVTELLCRLTGAEAALVVNNNAAAVLLALSTLAPGREVIVSRGQLVEIGGSFRIPDVMRQSGAMLVEVGTTNKTHLQDYAGAINEQTALLLHVHMSNYRIIGFTHEVQVAELAALGREHGLPLMSDLGSGSLINLGRFGLPHEPTVQETVAAGADVVTFSGDKLLGGPQAGIILGQRDYIDRMKKNPLTRAVRIDKLTLAALEATLREYLDPEGALKRIPTLRMLIRPLGEIRATADRVAADLTGALGAEARVWVEEGVSQVGGGALPTAAPATVLVCVKFAGVGESDLLRRLQQADPPVVARAERGAVVMDLRTVDEAEVPLLIRAFEDVVLEALHACIKRHREG